MDFIKCPVCSTPLSLRGDETIATCSICGAKINASLAKYLFATSIESIIKQSSKNLQTNISL